MSEIKVDTIGPRVDSGTLTIGAAGDTVNIAGTAGTGFPAGTTINNNADNRVITGSGTAGTLNGEANLNFNGSQLTLPTGSPSAPSLAHAGDTDTGIYFATNNIVFATGGVNRVELLADGNLSIRGENLQFEGSGKGVYLGTVSGAAANLLDDYETGVWTPNWITEGAGGGTVTGVSTNIASYVKVGNQVTLNWYGNIQTSGTAQGYQITNLPFTQKAMAGGSGGGAGCGVSISTGGTWWVQGSQNTTNVYLKKYDDSWVPNPAVQAAFTYTTD